MFLSKTDIQVIFWIVFASLLLFLLGVWTEAPHREDCILPKEKKAITDSESTPVQNNQPAIHTKNDHPKRMVVFLMLLAHTVIKGGDGA